MASRIIELADALVVSLNEQAFAAPPAIAERTYRPSYDLKDIKELRIAVVPASSETVLSDRVLAQYDIVLDVGVMKKLKLADVAEEDALMSIVQEIETHVRTTGAIGDGQWVATVNDPIFSQEHLAEHRQFTSILSFAFRLVSE